MDGTVKSSKDVEENEKKDKKRREEMGLSFLNNLNESFIRKKVEEERIKQEGITNIKIHEDPANKSNLCFLKKLIFELLIACPIKA